jgi:thioesterase domain-containing protein
MASRYLEEMFIVQPEGPYLLGGYSLGGIIAFEMAQQLRARGQRVSLLVLIDSRAPGFDAGNTEEGRDRRMLIFARELGLSPERLTLSSDHLRTLDADEKLLYVLAEATKQNLLPPGIEPRQIRSLWKVFEANFQAASRYAPQVYDRPITLFKAVNKPAGYSPALHEGWHALTLRGVEIKALPGDHFSIVREPHVETLAEMLAASIRESEREEDNGRA